MRLGGILGRYVLREVVVAWLAVTGVLLVILLANEVVGVMERAAANQYPQSMVLELIGLSSLQYLSVVVPVGLLLGVVLAFGRLYADSEMAAALACGAGPLTLYAPVALLALVVAIWLGWLSLVLAPEATAQVSSPRLPPASSAPSAPARARCCTRRAWRTMGRSGRSSSSVMTVRRSRWRSPIGPRTRSPPTA